MHKNQTFRLVILLIITGLYSMPASSKEGMWQPGKLKRQEDNMKRLGLSISVDKIYNENGTGLNNAIVLFGSGCTGEIISNQGLLLTNHHCGYGTIQSLSTKEHNYLINGFWASNNQTEIPCPGLKVKFVRKMENVTDYILSDLTDTMNQENRKKIIAARIVELEKAYKKTTHLDAEVKSYYEGNQYWISLMETFSDIRLVGTPPNGIGKFGADTDNWMWPRMTGDFSLFRVYANKDNKPAEYDIKNVPYKTSIFFPISTSGYKEGDFTMVYGFPFTTREYITSYQLAEVEKIMDPIRIEARKAKLAVWDEAMRTDPEIFLKYAAKQSSVSNGYKKWQGELMGLAVNKVMQKKEQYEKEFQMASTTNVDFPEDQLILPRIKAAVNGRANALKATEYIRETIMGIEAVNESKVLFQLLQLYRKNANAAEMQKFFDKSKKELASFYKNYDLATDKKVFLALMPIYMKQNDLIVSPELKKVKYEGGNNYISWANNVFQEAAITDEDKMEAYLEKINPADTLIFKEDPAFKIYAAVQNFKTNNIDPELKNFETTITPLNYIYMKRQMEYLNSGRDFYPDANQTLRLTYGQVKAIDLGTSNQYQTTLDELIPRFNPNIEEFDIPQKLRTLYETKDYGRWAVNGTIPLNFIATNHTSGGNSGSPVLNGKGELIGLNFDRIWQGTMSDLYYDPNLCRNVSVDIRYILFIMDKYGNANWLFKEMKLVK